jgi:4-hydroxybenzoate polyprenyltransferase
MTHPTIERSPRTPAIGLGTLWFVVITLGGAIARRGLAPDGALVLASLYALGTLGMAWITMRGSAYPFGSWTATAGVMSLALLATAALFPHPAQVEELAAIGWMFPALFLFVGLSPAPKRCAPGAAWSGGLLFGIGCFYAAILVVTTAMVRVR